MPQRCDRLSNNIHVSKHALQLTVPRQRAPARQPAHLGQIPDLVGAVPHVAVRPVVLGGDELARLQAPLDEEDVPRLVQRRPPAPAAAQHDLAAAELLHGGLHVLQGVFALARRRDARALEGAVAVEAAEELEGAGEVVDDLDAGGVRVGVARGAEGVDAAGVLVVLVRPEVGV